MNKIKYFIFMLFICSLANAQPYGFSDFGPNNSNQIFNNTGLFRGLLGASDITVQTALQTLSDNSSSSIDTDDQRYDEIVDPANDSGLLFGTYNNSWTFSSGDVLITLGSGATHTWTSTVVANKPFFYSGDTGFVGVGKAAPSITNMAMEVDGSFLANGAVIASTAPAGTKISNGNQYASLLLRPLGNYAGFFTCRDANCNPPYMTNFQTWDTGTGVNMDFCGGGWDGLDCNNIGFNVSPTYTGLPTNLGTPRISLIGIGTTAGSEIDTTSGDVHLGQLSNNSSFASSSVYALKGANAAATNKMAFAVGLLDYGVDMATGEGVSIDWLVPHQSDAVETGFRIEYEKTTAGENDTANRVVFSKITSAATGGPIEEFMQFTQNNTVSITNKLEAGSWGGASTNHSGISFGAFNNAWTFTTGNNVWTNSTSSLFFDGTNRKLETNAELYLHDTNTGTKTGATLCIDSNDRICKCGQCN